eukprot:TRINITY_DN19915_c0_g1_i1.p1 TRINITY_DN19915_c0_g1~~TRINITY_DN19915_c0_g1_i1.p1  ORF type:complete len:1112 (+),score=249.27 TRINITY_DN19915_c0_g1_i1:43-3336(+)
MAKGATHGTLAQLTAELYKRTSRFDVLLEEVERRHEVNREGGLAEWVARNLLLALRWLGSSTEAGCHFHPALVWLGGEGSTPPPSRVSQALSELPTLVGKLVDALRPVFLQDHGTLSGSSRRPSDLYSKLLTSVATFHRNKATLDLVIFHVVTAICTLRSYHLLRLNQALPTYLNKVEKGNLDTEPGSQLLEDLPVCAGWDKAPAASGKFQRLEMPCRAKLEEMNGVSREDLKLCMFTQVGCGETTDSDEEGQWEGYTVRVCVSVDATAMTAYENLQLTVSSMTPGCEIKGIRTTLSSYDSEEWNEANDVVVTLPTINPGHQHDLLVLGSVRSVGLVEVVFYVGAAPWTREDHRRLRVALAVASGVELDQLRFAEVGDVDEDGCAGVLCAFPDHKQPRIAQATLLNVLSDCTTPGDRGLPYAVKYFGAAQPTTPDISAQLKFRFQHLEDKESPPKASKGKAVVFNTTKDVGDTLSEGACLAERWGMHSARVREEVFRQNLCTVLDRVHAESDDSNKWKKELVKTLTSPLYDHPLSELRQTRLVKELLWIALSDTVDNDDPNERSAIISSLRLQRHIANTDPINPAAEARHTLFSTYPSEVTAGLHRACTAINDELQRMNRFLEIARYDLPLKELLVQEDIDRTHVANTEYEERVTIMKSRRLAVIGKSPAKKKKEKSTDYHIQSPIRPKSPMPKKRTPTSAKKNVPKEVVTPRKKKAKDPPGHVPIWQRAHALYTHQQYARSTSQGVTPVKSRTARERSQTPDSRISRNSSLVRTSSAQQARSTLRERVEGLSSIQSQLRRPGSSTKKGTRKSVSPPSTTRSARSRSQSVERDLSDVLRSPSQSFTSSSKRSSKWLNESLGPESKPRKNSKANSNGRPPSPFGKTARAKKHLTQPKDDVVGPWLSEGTTRHESMTPPSMLTPPSMSLQTSPRRHVSPKRFPFALGDRVCVKCGITNVQSIFAEVGMEWRDHRDRYVGCPGYVRRINFEEERVEIVFDPSAVPTHDTRAHTMVWPVQAVEAEATSPVPPRQSPQRARELTSPLLSSLNGPTVSDPPPNVVRRGKHGTPQTKRIARLGCLFASPAAAAIVAAVAAVHVY